MTGRITDSALYRHLWGTDEARAVLGEEGRLAGWLEVITALARVQAEAASRQTAEEAKLEATLSVQEAAIRASRDEAMTHVRDIAEGAANAIVVKLTGKPALSIDSATEITPVAGVSVAGPWMQSPPKDFSRPELRWFSWGFEHQAIFAAKAATTGAPARVRLQGQACTETICKNVDVTIAVPGAISLSGSTSKVRTTGPSASMILPMVKGVARALSAWR